MQAENNFGKEFRPNRSKKNLLILYVACGIFICMGLAGIITGIQNQASESGFIMGVAVAGFALLLLIAGHFFTSPLNISYHVNKNNIVLKQGKKTLSISYGEMESLTHLKEKQSEEFILKLQHTTVDKQKERMSETKQGGNVIGMLKNVFKEQIRAFEKYKFLSVPISYTSSGRQQGPKKANSADLPCDTIFILLKNGEGYLISPLDVEGFMNEAKKYFNS